MNHVSAITVPNHNQSAISKILYLLLAPFFKITFDFGTLKNFDNNPIKFIFASFSIDLALTYTFLYPSPR